MGSRMKYVLALLFVLMPYTVKAQIDSIYRHVDTTDSVNLIWYKVPCPRPIPEHRINIDTLTILDTVFTAWEQDCRRCPKRYYHDTQVRALMVIDSVFTFDRVDTSFVEVPE